MTGEGESVRIPRDAEIAEAKITRYLLVPRVSGDKAAYLASAGYTQDSAMELMEAIRRHAQSSTAVRDRMDEFGERFVATGILPGRAGGRDVGVSTIWLKSATDGRFHFVTLIPNRGALK